MKNKIIALANKKTALISGGILVASSFAVVLIPHMASSSFDLDGLNQQVQNQDQQLQNHDARISNTEKDVSELQKNTSTAPSETKTAVPAVTRTAVTTQSPTPVPQTAPVADSPTPVASPAPPPTRTMVKSDSAVCLSTGFFGNRIYYSDGSISENVIWAGGYANPQDGHNPKCYEFMSVGSK